MCLYSLRVNMSVAIVVMVNDIYTHVQPQRDPEECRDPQKENRTMLVSIGFGWFQLDRDKGKYGRQFYVNVTNGRTKSCADISDSRSKFHGVCGG